MIMRVLRVLTALFLAVAVLLGVAPSAMAHDPMFITADQTTPDTGPFMPDGTISWALYGSVLDAGDTRGFEFDLREGDEVFVSLLIPNLSPEVDLPDGELPVIELEAPDGTMTMIIPEVRDVFDEPFSNTSYVTLAEYRQPGLSGRYRGLVVGGAAARFSVAIGETEIFFTDTERSGERPSNFAEITVPLTAWYTTLPNGDPDPNSLADGEAEIDLDMIEDAMESGEAEAPEGSLDEAPAASVEEAALPAEAEAADPADTEEAVEPDTTETASTPVEPDGGSSTTWVAPVLIGAVAVVGAGVFMARRKPAA